MRISFEWESPNIRQIINELICKYRGHKWVKYVDYYVDNYFSLLRNNPAKECKVCGKFKYKKSKSKMIVWSRYGAPAGLTETVKGTKNA